MRSRLVVAFMSFVCFLVFVVVMWFDSSPSSLLHIEPRPLKPHKVSVIVLDVDPQHIKQLCLDVVHVLSKEKLEPEFLLSVDGAVNFNIHDVKVKGHHMETFPRRPSFTGSVLEGFKRSHFAVMVVVGDLTVDVSRLLPELVNPVINRECDMALAKHTDTTHILLGLLSLPLTFSLSGGENATSFSLSRAVWLKTCSQLQPDASSLSLELLAKCSVHGHKTVHIAGGTADHVHELQMFTQILSLYWMVHPVWCVLIAIVTGLGLLVLGMKTLRTNSKGSLVIL